MNHYKPGSIQKCVLCGGSGNNVIAYLMDNFAPVPKCSKCRGTGKVVVPQSGHLLTPGCVWNRETYELCYGVAP